MLEILLIASIIFLSVYGIGEILHRLWIKTIGCKNCENVLLLMLRDNNAYEQSVAAINERRWWGDNTAFLVIGVDCGLSDETYRNCLSLENENDDYLICALEDIGEVIKEMR